MGVPSKESFQISSKNVFCPVHTHAHTVSYCFKMYINIILPSTCLPRGLSFGLAFSVCTYRLSQAQYIFCMYLSFIPGTVHILYVLIAYPRHSTFSVCTYRLSQAQYIFRPSPAVVLLVISTNCVSLDNAVVFASIGTAPLGPDVLST